MTKIIVWFAEDGLVIVICLKFVIWNLEFISPGPTILSPKK